MSAYIGTVAKEAAIAMTMMNIRHVSHSLLHNESECLKVYALKPSMTYGVAMNSGGPSKKNPTLTMINPNMMNQRWPYNLNAQ